MTTPDLQLDFDCSENADVRALGARILMRRPVYIANGTAIINTAGHLEVATGQILGHQWAELIAATWQFVLSLDMIYPPRGWTLSA